jgi:iron complex transport system substrate-binding protein
MRIASLLPGATEACFALGLGDQVVAVSHECDHPAPARERPRVTGAQLPAAARSAEIDRAVRDRVASGLSIYLVDHRRLAELAPDLVITQDTCEVCAVSLADVEAGLRREIGAAVELLSLAPATLADALGDIERIAGAAGVAGRGAALVAELRARLDRVAAATTGERPRVLVLEWLDPPMIGGHWTPELIRIAGGEPVCGHDGGPTRATDWAEVAGSGAEVVLAIPCGFDLERTAFEIGELARRPGFAALPAARDGRVFAIDGNAYFNRPGPRLVDSVEIAAALIGGREIPAGAMRCG